MKKTAAKVWTFSSSYKFEKAQAVDAFANDAQKRLVTAKNRHEAFQIVIKADEDIFYGIEFSDFKDGRGNVIPKESFGVYKERFVAIATNFHTNGFPIGRYPDALFPFETVKARKDNLATAGENEILYVELATTPQTVAGIYRGEIMLFLQDRMEIAFEVEVKNVLLTDEVTHKSLFYANAEMMAHFEEDKSQETYDLYKQFLIDHRLGCTELAPQYHHENDEWIAGYADRLYDDVVNRGLSYTNIPSNQLQGVKPKTYDKETLKKYLRALIDKSLATGYDLFRKVCFFNWCIDEPFTWADRHGRVSGEIAAYEQMLEDVIAEYEKQASESDFCRQVLSSMRKMPHVITDFYERADLEPREMNYDENGERYLYDLKKVVLCPKYDGLDTPEKRRAYVGETWWYNCGTANSPMPAFHIDEAGYAPRIVEWMMSDFGVVGQLYWSVNHAEEMFWSETEPNKLLHAMIKDPYGIRRGLGCNGDGTIIYPGKPYGVRGPLPSLRFKGIRDGYEDYELLGALKRNYAKRGVSAKNILARMTAPVYHNARIDGDARAFDLAKEGLYGLLSLAELGVTLDAKTMDNEIEITVAGVADGVRVDRVSLKKQSDGYMYRTKKQARYAAFEIAVGETRETLPVYLGDGLKIYRFNETDTAFSIAGVKNRSYNYDEGIHQLSLVLDEKEPKATLVFSKLVLRSEKLGVIMVAKEAAAYRIRSGGKILLEGEFEKPDNDIVGSVRRIDVRSEELTDGALEIELSKAVPFGLREVYTRT